MAKGLSPGVGRSLRKESVEKRERVSNIPQGTWKTNKALTQSLYHSRGHRASSGGGLDSPRGKVSLAGFHAPKS